MPRRPMQNARPFLNAHGYRVLRFWNNEVLAEIDAVMAAIHEVLCEEPPPTPNPSPPQGGGRGTAPSRLLKASAGQQRWDGSMPEFLQFLFSGLTVGAIYALVALGFTLIYNASDVINFAQGEFVMLGGMVTVFAAAAGVPLPLAALLAIVVAVAVGLLLHRLAIEPARGASAVTLIIITIGASILLRGVAAVVFDKHFHSLPPLLGAEPWNIGGAAMLPQSLVVLIGDGVHRGRAVGLHDPHAVAARR